MSSLPTLSPYTPADWQVFIQAWRAGENMLAQLDHQGQATLLYPCIQLSCSAEGRVQMYLYADNTQLVWSCAFVHPTPPSEAALNRFLALYEEAQKRLARETELLVAQAYSTVRFQRLVRLRALCTNEQQYAAEVHKVEQALQHAYRLHYGPQFEPPQCA